MTPVYVRSNAEAWAARVAESKVERESAERRVPLEVLHFARGEHVTLLLKNGDVFTDVVRLVGYMRPGDNICLGRPGEPLRRVKVDDIADVEVPQECLDAYRAHIKAYGRWTLGYLTPRGLTKET